MSTADAGADPGNKPEGDDKPITKSELLSLLTGFKSEFLKDVHTAISDRSKRIKKDLDTQLAALKPPKPEEGEEGAGDEDKPLKSEGGAPEPKPAGQPLVKPQPDPEVAKLRKDLERMAAKQKEAEQQAAAEKKARVHAEGHQAIKTALTGKVVAGAEGAVLDMLRGRGAVHIADDGSVRLKLGGKDEPEEGLDLEEGIETLSKASEFKFFAPPPGSGGNNGARRTPTQQGSTTPARPSNGAGQLQTAIEAYEQKTGQSFDQNL